MSISDQIACLRRGAGGIVSPTALGVSDITRALREMAASSTKAIPTMTVMQTTRLLG